MPRGDGTGPQGLGSMTGRGAGYCAGSGGMAGNANAALGRGFGAGSGRGPGVQGTGFRYGGQGYRCRFFAAGIPAWNRFRAYSRPNQGADPELEKQALKNQADILKSELDLIKTRLAELDNPGSMG